MQALDRGLLLIAIFKLVKAAILALLGLAGLIIPRTELIALFTRAAAILHPGAGFTHRLLGKLDGVSATTEKLLALLLLLYAALFTVEGLGLLAGKRWAEWLTVAVTASFIPLELYELVHKPGPGRALTLALNVAVVAYLAHRRLVAA